MPQVVETETREVGFVGGRVPGGAVGAGSAWRVVLLAVTGTGDAATRSLTHSRASTASSTAVGGGDPDEAVADLPTTPGSGWRHSTTATDVSCRGAPRSQQQRSNSEGRSHPMSTVGGIPSAVPR